MKRITLQLLSATFAIFPIFAIFATASATTHTSEAEIIANHTDELAFRIENAKAYVGIAAVNLSVSTLKQVDGQLIGDYKIVVPLSKKSNDNGRIVLEIDQDFNKIGREGGTLYGLAYSKKDNTRPNRIVCKIGPLTNKDIELAITTEKRTLNFDSTYTLLRIPASSTTKVTSTPITEAVANDS